MEERVLESAQERPPEGIWKFFRHLAVIGIAGVVTGVLVGGLGSRLFMRLAGATGRAAARGATTEAGFTVGEVTLEGTIGLVVFVGIAIGMIGAILYVVFRPWLAWAGRWRGIVFGVLLFALGSASSDVMNPDNIDFLILGNGVVSVSLIVLLFIGFGAAMEPIHRYLDGRISTDPGRVARITYVVLTIIGLLGLRLLAEVMFTEEACHCGPPVLPAWFTIVAGVGTVLWLLGRRHEWVDRASRLAGHVGVAGVAVFGLARAITDGAEIIR